MSDDREIATKPLRQIHDELNEFRYGGAMDEGQDIRTNLICITNFLLDIVANIHNERIRRKAR